MTDTHPRLAREGWAHIIIVLALALAASWLVPVLAALAWLLVVFVVQFFRDPHRKVPQAQGLVVAPADGKVIAIGPTTDPYRNCPAIKVSVFMNVFNVHSNRAPIAGKVIKREYRAGKFVNAALDKASETNEANALIMSTAAGEITCVQIAGLVARRIKCYVDEHDMLARGQRYGFIRFGSRVDVYLPTHCEVRVAPGDIVYAGEDVIALMTDTDA